MGDAVTDLSDANIIRLDESNLALANGFDCGDKDLNEFLQEDALDHLKGKAAVTYLFMQKGKMLGYFCLSMFAIEPTEKALQILHQRGKKYKLFPALLIARLGVDMNFMLKGVGTEIIRTIIGLALKESERIGCRFIVVDAYSDAVGFYERNEFKILSKKKTDSETIRMYLDLLREF